MLINKLIKNICVYEWVYDITSFSGSFFNVVKSFVHLFSSYENGSKERLNEYIRDGTNLIEQARDSVG